MASQLHVTREKNAILTLLKDVKRPDLLDVCKTHDIKGLNRARTLLEVSLAEHCIAEHSGRVVNLGKCDKAQLGSSTSSRPLSSLKRAATDPAARPAHALASSTSTSSSALQAIQDRLEELSRRCVTREQVQEIVDARCAEHQAAIQNAFSELHEMCQNSIQSMQLSLQPMDAWKDQVTEAFEGIQSWARDIEGRILVNKPPTALPKHLIADPSRAPLTLSSTPSSSATHLPCYTPAAQPIAGGSSFTKRVRLSDASEYSLATIPEQHSTPEGGLLREEMLQADSAEGDLVEEEGVTPEVANDQFKEANSPLRQTWEEPPAILEPAVVSRPSDVVVWEGNRQLDGTTSTPVAAKTLFGTERSLDERFEDGSALSELEPTANLAGIVWAKQSTMWLQASS